MSLDAALARHQSRETVQNRTAFNSMTPTPEVPGGDKAKAGAPEDLPLDEEGAPGEGSLDEEGSDDGSDRHA